ncbi:MAG: GntR family transcriptional regulator [Rhizobiaceae bacterium]|nr:GntR family transcriptional regulator [Rhizobiaceae bacterium]
MAAITRAEDLKQTLETKILSGELLPGTRLDEQGLAHQFNISRTPVREALRQLGSSGLVDMRSRQTPIVAIITVQKLIQMFEVMAELEGLCARLATRRITSQQRSQLLRSQDDLKESLKTDEPMRFYEVNREFHEVIYEAASSEFLAEQTRNLRNRVSPYRRHVTAQPGRMIATIAEHQAVIDAMSIGDSDAAATAMRRHVNLLGDSLADLIAHLPSDMIEGTIGR